MTEAEWLASEDPVAMLEDLRGKARDRQLRLFVCASCREIWDDLDAELARPCVEIAEQFVEGLVLETELTRVRSIALEADFDRIRQGRERHEHPQHHAPITPLYFAAEAAFPFCPYPVVRLPHLIKCHPQTVRVCPGLLRDIFGNSFRPIALDSSVLPPAVVSLAQAAYDRRLLPSGQLDLVRLADLADALEENGGPDEVVSHLRSPGPHVRGCWAADAVLGLS